MSKNMILIVVSILFLVASVLFDFSQKRAYKSSLADIKQEKQEIKHISALKNLWGAKGVKSKLDKVVLSISKEKIQRYNLKRGKADIKLNLLTEKEVNRVLSKLAMMPVQFKKLLITKDAKRFTLETLCVW